MLTILTQGPAEAPLSLQPEAVREGTEPGATGTSAQEPGDYELVLGRGQIASVLFVAIVILVVFSAISYLAGKWSVPHKASATPPETVVLEQLPVFPQTPVVPATATVVPPASPIEPPVTAAAPESGQEPPLFDDPVKGAVYLQMGAVEQGIAVIFVEGLRRRGFRSFAAPGPNEKIFRVLIGPIPDPKAFTQAKEAVDQIGLATFARKYQQ
jgi:cell division septation protein DedD